MKKLTVTCVLTLACSLFVYADPAADAQAAATRIIQSAQAGNINAIYQQLPASYRTDLSDIVKAFGTKIDPELWKASMDLIGEAADVANSKADLVAEIITESKKLPKAELQLAVKNISTAMKAFSQKVTVKTLQNGNLAGILADPEIGKFGPAITPFLKDSLDGVKVLGATAGENGLINIEIQNKDGKKETTAFRKVDQKWVPDNLAKDWTKSMADAKKSISELKIDEKNKQQFLQTVPALKMGLQQLKNAKDAQTLQSGAGMMMLPLMMMGGNKGE